MLSVLRYTLRTLAAIGILGRLSGILFGRPHAGVALEQFIEYDNAILQIVRHEQGLTDLPVITNMDSNHTDPLFVPPYGLQAEIDCQSKRFSIL